MNLFEMAVKARLPLIRCTTDDLIHVPLVVRFYAGKRSNLIMCETVEDFPEEEGLIILAQGWSGDLLEIHKGAQRWGGSVLFVNAEEESSLLFDVGEVPVPEKLFDYHVGTTVGKELLPMVKPALRGLPIFRALEVLQLASGYYGDIDPRNIKTIRRMLVPAIQGLDEIELDLPVSIPRIELESFLTAYRGAYEAPNSGSLSPRGLLLTGAPGVGKTHLAKVLAKDLGVPLYRASLGGAMDRWHGQSEQNLRRMLAAAENEAPCVLLIDEVEKEINTSDDSGVSNRMLASLLWWLAEHQAKVITVMTTNDKSKLPPELYRPGRVNEVIDIKPLTMEEAKLLVVLLFKHFSPKAKNPEKHFQEVLSKLIDETMTPVYIESTVQQIIRSHYQ